MAAGPCQLEHRFQGGIRRRDSSVLVGVSSVIVVKAESVLKTQLIGNHGIGIFLSRNFRGQEHGAGRLGPEPCLGESLRRSREGVERYELLLGRRTEGEVRCRRSRGSKDDTIFAPGIDACLVVMAARWRGARVAAATVMAPAAVDCLMYFVNCLSMTPTRQSILDTLSRSMMNCWGLVILCTAAMVEVLARPGVRWDRSWFLDLVSPYLMSQTQS